jgi:hypothetical protein
MSTARADESLVTSDNPRSGVRAAPKRPRELGRRYAPIARVDVVTADLRHDPRSAESDDEMERAHATRGAVRHVREGR